MSGAPETLQDVTQLATRLDALELRVTVLERGAVEKAPAALNGHRGSVAMEQPVATAAEGFSVFGVFPVMGAALLGIAGAYLLRAISSANVIPREIVAAAAAGYAAGWLVTAQRRRGRRFAAAVYAGTSLLILGPMLWETTVVFRAMSGTAAAVILAGFVALLVGLRVHARDEADLGFAYAGLGAMGLVLSIGTHRMAEFTALLVAMYAVAEFRENRGLVRAGMCAIADLAAWTLVYLYRLPASERADYPALPGWVAPALALATFGIAAGSLAVRVLRQRKRVTVFEATQAMMAFGILLCGLGWMMPDHWRGAIGGVCLALAIGCAVTAYGPLRESAERRNFHLFSVWALALLGGAVWLLMPASAASVLLVFMGMALLVYAQATGLVTLDWQGLVLLIAGAFTSGLMGWGFDVLAGTMPGPPAWRILLVVACLAAGYAVLREYAGEGAEQQIVHLIPAVLLTYGLAALGARGVMGAAGTGMKLEIFHVALLRTVVLCALAVLLALGGVRLRRPQMVRVAYCALAFVAAKLLFEDLRHGNMAFIAGSICLVALTMIAVPRLGRAATSGARDK